MKLVTKYQISAINSCSEKCAYMFNVDKNQLSRQIGSRNMMVPILDLIISPLPEGGGGILIYLCPSVLPKYFSSHFSQQLLMVEI
jgi:hypothetical protein